MRINLPFSSVLLGVSVLCTLTGCGDRKEPSGDAQQTTSDLHLEKIPPRVMNALMAKFPGAEIRKWTEEKEGDVLLYDIEFSREGGKFEADIRADGSIRNWEKSVGAGTLSQVVKIALDTQYPEAVIIGVMEVRTVTDGVDVLEAYEIVLETGDMMEVEVMVSPDGEIMEDSGSEKGREESGEG